MNVRSVVRAAALTGRTAFPFSKNPFDKFNRNKQPSPKRKNEPRTQSPEPLDKNSTNQSKPSSSDSQLNSAKSDFDQKHQASQKQTGGFDRFSKRRREEKKRPRPQEADLSAEEPKKKDKPIPTIKLDLEEEDKDLPKMRLRKPSPPSNFTHESKGGQKEGERPEGEEAERWEQLEREIQRKKQKNKLINTLRFKRMNLLREEERPKGKGEEQKNSTPPPPPADLKSHLAKLIAAGLGLMLVSSSSDLSWSRGREVTAEELKRALEEGRVEKTWINETEVESNNDEGTKGKNIHRYVYVLERDGTISYCLSNKSFQKLWLDAVFSHNSQLDLKAELSPEEGRKIIIGQKVVSTSSNFISNTRTVLSLVLLYFFIKSISQLGRGNRGKGKGGGLNMFENDRSYRLKQSIKVTFREVVGMQKAKQEIVEFIDFLKHPEKYHKLGARIPKGALLTGPPGTGKTMIAKACAGESNVPFFTISGSEFIEMYVGVGAQRVRNLFKEAKENSPSIIFIDEIDAVGKKRTGGFGGGNDERDTTLNQLLVEMDGFDNKTNVIVFAATNQKEVLDQALTRPGRFDRLIDIDLPDLQGRAQIFEVHLRPLVLESRIQNKEYARRLATLTPGFSGADIKNVCNEAAIIAARVNKEFISIADFEAATERIIGGVQRKSQLITEETRRTVSYHECGHGVVSWFLEHSNPLLKLTIIPRSKGALGFAQYLPNEHQMFTRAKLLDEICVILGGRVSEEVFFGRVSTGASDDLNKAYQVAKTLLTQYGFGQTLGWLNYHETEYAKEYSKSTEDSIDAEILQIMRACTLRTRAIITEKKDLIEALAEKLLEAQTIDQTVIEGILGPRPFAMSQQHQQYVAQKRRMSEDVKREAEKQEVKAEFRRADLLC